MEASPDLNYKNKYEEILSEKKKMEREFGQKRGQFKQIYLQCEEQLKNEKEVSRQLDIQIKELMKQVDSLKSENEGIRIAAQFSEESKEEEFVSLKAKHQEEIASLQHIWQEASKDSQTRLAKEFEQERNKLLEANSKLEQRIKSDMRLSEEGRGSGEGLMSMMSNAFAKKPSTASLTKQKGVDGPSLTLEGSQQQVQQEIGAWKEIVDPLEKEIVSLKQQLEEANLQLNAKEAKSSEIVESKVSQELQDEVKLMRKYFDAERSARTDLEMYVAVLNTQKGVLQEDADKLKRELHNVCRLFEQEKMSHTELKETWKLANDQFLEQQNNLAFENDKMKKLLTPQQLEQISRNVRKERLSNKNSSEESSCIPVQDNAVKGSDLIAFDTTEESSNTPKSDNINNTKQQAPKLNRKDDIGSRNTFENIGKPVKLSDSLLNSLFPSAFQAKHFNELLQDKPLYLSSSSEEDDSDVDLEQAIRRQNMNRYGIEAAEEVDENRSSLTNLKKSNSSNDILNPNIIEIQHLHEKALSHGDVSISSKDKTYGDEIESKLSLNETGWSTVSDDYSHVCLMCQNYEKQLQRLQKAFIDLTEKEMNVSDNLSKTNEQLDTEKEKLLSLERSIESAAVDTKSQVNIYKNNQEEVDKQVQRLYSQFQQFEMDIQKELTSLSEERDRGLAEYTSLREEHDVLRQLSNNDTAQLSADYIAFKTEAASTEEQLKSELMFMKERATAEQYERETTEHVLQQDLNEARALITDMKHRLKAASRGHSKESDNSKVVSSNGVEELEQVQK